MFYAAILTGPEKYSMLQCSWEAVHYNDSSLITMWIPCIDTCRLISNLTDLKKYSAYVSEFVVSTLAQKSRDIQDDPFYAWKTIRFVMEKSVFIDHIDDIIIDIQRGISIISQDELSLLSNRPLTARAMAKPLFSAIWTQYKNDDRPRWHYDLDCFYCDVISCGVDEFWGQQQTHSKDHGLFIDANTFPWFPDAVS